VLVIVAIMAVGGCSLSPTSPVSESENITLPPDLLLEYRRIGGIAGLDDQLLITNSGVITLTRKGQSFSGQLDGAQMQNLHAILAAAHFADLNAEYLPARQGADYLEHVIMYEGHSVKTFDTATPAMLQPLLALLSEIIKSTNQSTQ